MEKVHRFSGIKKIGTSTENLPSEESNGETYEVYPGWPYFAKGMVYEFHDVPEGQRQSSIDNKDYKHIERLIIEWSNDNTKTAGTLARRICDYLNKHE